MTLLIKNYVLFRISVNLDFCCLSSKQDQKDQIMAKGYNAFFSIPNNNNNENKNNNSNNNGIVLMESGLYDKSCRKDVIKQHPLYVVIPSIHISSPFFFLSKWTAFSCTRWRWRWRWRWSWRWREREEWNFQPQTF